MIDNLPIYIPLIFGLTTILTLMLFYLAMRRLASAVTSKTANTILGCLIIWLIIQTSLTLRHVYSTDTTSIPPKVILLGVLPAIITIVILFATRSGRAFIDSLPVINMTYLHIIRIPVEFVLLWLFMHNAVPQLMTFEGRNFDIVSGISAPFVAYFGFTKRKISRRLILAWNFICLALLFNIVIHALLSAVTPMQKLAFDQPNIAIVYFPFSWLPSFVVPVVLFAHLVSIRQLTRGKKGLEDRAS